jgi:K+-sensing histidine kinase KdpD
MRRWSGGLFASVAMVAVVTIAVALLGMYVPVLSLLVLYLLAVLPVAVLWGVRLATLTSLGSVVVFAAVFLEPRGFWMADEQSVASLGVFLVTAIVVAELAARSRRAAVESERLMEEQSHCGGSPPSLPARPRRPRSSRP